MSPIYVRMRLLRIVAVLSLEPRKAVRDGDVCAATPGSCFSSLGADRMPGQRHNRYQIPNQSRSATSLPSFVFARTMEERSVPISTHVYPTSVYVCYECVSRLDVTNRTGLNDATQRLLVHFLLTNLKLLIST